MTDISWAYNDWPSGEPYNWAEAARGDSKYAAIDFHVDLGCGKLKKGRIGIDRYPSPGVNVVMDLDQMLLFGMAPEAGRDAVTNFTREDGPNRGKLTGAFRVHTPGNGEIDHWDYHSLDSELRAYNTGIPKLPFGDGEIESIISHHALEHIGDGFIPLVDEVYRVLKPGGLFYVITPLFPSRAAVEDPDHKRYFMCNEHTCTWDAFCGHLGDENNPTGSWLDSFSVPYTKARFEMLDKDYTAPLPPEQQWGENDVREVRVALGAVK